jgi:protein O-GlcNAc transferase
MPSIDRALQLHVAGRIDEAEVIYRSILQKNPRDPNALHLLGVVAYQKRRYEEAADLIIQAIRLEKKVPDFRNNLGNVYLAQGRLDEAEECYQKALQLNPAYVDACNNLANVYRDRGKFREAAYQYRKAIRIDPSRPEIHNNLGMVLVGLDRLDEAIRSFQEAVRLKPDFCDAYCNLGSAFKTRGMFAEALESCSAALSLNPAYARAFLMIGNVYSQTGQVEKGGECYRKALEIDPNLCEAHLNLGHTLREEGQKEEAADHFRRALDLKPDLLSARMGHCIGQIPLLADSADEIGETRRNYRRALEKLSREIDLSDPHVLSQAISLVGNCQPFYLAYQGENNRELQSLYGDLMVRFQSACFPVWSKKRSMPGRKSGEPLRVGIVSGFYFLHSNWKIPIKGWVEKLDRRNFRLFGYYTGNRVDSQTETARRLFDRFIEGAGSLDQWCRLIVRDRLHVLIYPEIGMDPATVRLASLRLAPIQCTSWGHPDTSGLPTIDYYLSSDLMEPDDADAHYREKLVRLPNLSIFYEPPGIEPAPVDRSYFGLGADDVVYLCTQSLFKYLPQFDAVFPRIAQEVDRCRFVFLNYSKSPKLGERFMRRLASAFSRCGLRAEDYVRLLPHLDPHHYRALNQSADIFLDSLGWSGCNSTLEAISCNLPVVTMPGTLMRGRHTHAILKMMGLAETEARDLDGYVGIARRMGNDSGWRRNISEQTARLKHRTYRDEACIRGLEDFLRSAVEQD